MPKLQVFLHQGAETSHELLEDIITIGRQPDNTIQIEDASVSSHHAQLTLVGGDYHLKDLNSTNGTYVNDAQVTEAQLKAGDKIRFGKVDATYVSEIAASGGVRPMPEAEAMAITPAANSRRPEDFGSFKQKAKTKRDPIGVLVVLVGIVAMLAAVGAAFLIYSLQAP